MHGKGVISSAKEASFITRKAFLGSDISVLPGAHNWPLAAVDSVPHLNQPKQSWINQQPEEEGRESLAVGWQVPI